MSAIQNRYEFVILFDVENGNPNGDPDAGNMPRIDPETGLGLVTDVCLKRKVRNYVELAKEGATGYRIYVQEKAVLNQKNQEAYTALSLKAEPKKLPKKPDDARAVTAWMCENFFDIRTFGAVMSTEVNCGQVRGPVQLTFARSVEPVVPAEVSITRMAVTNEKDLEKERTMGRKFIVPYGLYRMEGFVSVPLAEKSGFADDDLDLLWEALSNMFEHDRSAARGKMGARKLFIFKHEKRMGNAPAQKLFDMVHCRRTSEGPARGFADYAVTLEGTCPEGISVEERL
ncbi:MAG: type I-C CRISPR-associated protein Cas7/Csd2 [Desulfovibrio sp.]|nr:type I-C CRISPR-associated protein Cas7/Csd2 [Desulfovibrio sp.]MDY4940678.1 type I-C CRISPR-associated protein Cas7/Csd2 [Desulfovibrio sp.]